MQPISTWDGVTSPFPISCEVEKGKKAWTHSQVFSPQSPPTTITVHTLGDRSGLRWWTEFIIVTNWLKECDKEGVHAKVTLITRNGCMACVLWRC